MSRRLWVYFDESVVPGEAGPAHAFLVGALVRDRPLLEPDNAAWRELVQTPHATGRAGGLDGPALRALLDGSLGRLFVHEREPTLQRIKEQAYLDLLVHVVLATGLGAGDELALFPERFDPGGGERTAGKFEGLVAALRWIVPEVPSRVSVESFPGEVHVLVGHSAVDLGLLYLSRRMRERRAGLVQVAPAGVSALAVPPVGGPRVLAAWLRYVLGLPVEVEALASLPIGALRQALERRAPSAEETEGWLAGLGPLAEAPGGRAEAVERLLEACLVTGEGAVARRHAYLLARVRTHRGRTRAAIDAWNRWDEAAEAVPLDRPSRVAEETEGRLALAVLLTDLRDTEESLRTLDRAERGLEVAWSLAKDPLLARIRGARAQARLLGGDPQVLDLLAASLDAFDAPVDRSYAWTWTLVALGRGADAPDPVAVAEAVVADVVARERRPIEALVGTRPFLRWGLAEALLRPEIAGRWPRADVLRAALHAWATDARAHHPDVLTTRALALAAPSLGAWTPWVGGATPDVGAFTIPDAAQLCTLRSVAATLRRSDAAPSWNQHLRTTLFRAMPEVEAVEDFTALAGWYRSFLAIEPARPETIDAFLARGGY
jgi:hypothetical protein